MKSNANDLFLEIDESKPLPIVQWFDELIWYPSQCYYHNQHNGIDYILYLHWRWENPWQAHMITNAASLDDMHGDNATWSENVFLLNRAAFHDEELNLVKAKLIDFSKRNIGEFPDRKRYNRPTSRKPNDKE